jgi:hypothetical protein
MHRGRYNTKPIEPRGEQPDEFRMAKYFWKNHKMEDVITWDTEKLEAELEAFYQAFQDLQISRKPGWWYPEDPMSVILKKNKGKRESKYKADSFNPKIDNTRKK